MDKIKKLFTNWRVIILLVFLLFSLIAINPRLMRDGVAIRSVTPDSAADIAGFIGPSKSDNPVNREVIVAINGEKISDIDDYYRLTSNLKLNQTISLTTKENYFFTSKTNFKTLKIKPKLNITVLPELEEISYEEIVKENIIENGTNKTVNKTVTKTRLINKTKKEVIGVEDIGLNVYNAPQSNIRKGLDLEGGTRVLMKPERELTEDEMGMLIEGIKQRIDVYGLSDIVVREATDLSGNQYVLVEVAGINEQKVSELITTQGEFEARIANQTAFKGGSDIAYVCRTPDCSGLDPRNPCGKDPNSNKYFCGFRFGVSLSPGAAESQASLTKDLEVVGEAPNRHLSEQIVLHLDDKEVDRLYIGESLRGKAETEIQISGSGESANVEQARLNALDEMLSLQTILTTGSLPAKLEVVKTDSISPVLGEQFVRNALITGLFAILAVAVFIFIRYRKIEIVIPMAITSISEVILLLGLASLINWNLDLSAIAGIIIAVGTGVDHQIVITDEITKGESGYHSWKDKFKKAFFIIMIAYATTMVAMVPLLFAGAGLLKGFAITTMMGVSFGVLVTRPAFAAILQHLKKS